MAYLGHSSCHSDPLPEEWIAVEKEWEFEGLQRGIDRYRKHIEKANQRAVETNGRAGGLIDTDAGSLIMRQVVAPLANAIAAAQIIAMDSLGERGRPPAWAKTILTLSAEEWAVITIRSVLLGLSPAGQNSRPSLSVALNIGSNAKLQVEFNLWKEAEAERAKEARKNGEVHVNLHQLMLKRVKSVDRRNAQKWMRLSKVLTKLQWTKEERIHVGSAMISMLIEHGGGWFAEALIPRGSASSYQVERHIVLTDSAKRVLHSYQEMTELQRPFMVPMKRPPAPWKWTDDEEGTPTKVARGGRSASLRPQGRAEQAPTEAETEAPEEV